MEKAMATHSSTLAWKIPWMEEPGRLKSLGLLRVGHNWATSLSLFTFMHWRRKWQPTPAFLPGESQGRGAWWVSPMGSHRVRHHWSNLAAAAAVTPSQLLRIRTIFGGCYYSVSYTKVSRALRFRMADKVCHSSKSLIPWAVSQGDYAESSEINSDSVCNGWQSILSCGTRS